MFAAVCLRLNPIASLRSMSHLWQFRQVDDDNDGVTWSPPPPDSVGESPLSHATPDSQWKHIAFGSNVGLQQFEGQSVKQGTLEPRKVSQEKRFETPVKNVRGLDIEKVAMEDCAGGSVQKSCIPMPSALGDYVQMHVDDKDLDPEDSQKTLQMAGVVENPVDSPSAKEHKEDVADIDPPSIEKHSEEVLGIGPQDIEPDSDTLVVDQDVSGATLKTAKVKAKAKVETKAKAATKAKAKAAPKAKAKAATTQKKRKLTQDFELVGLCSPAEMEAIMEHSQVAIDTNAGSSSDDQPLNVNDQVLQELEEAEAKEDDLTEELVDYGPVAPPWLRGSSWEGRPFPKNARLSFALVIRKEAHFRRKLKTQAVSTAAHHLKSAGFFSGTRRPEMWPNACREWNDAMLLPGAEPSSASSIKAASELIIGVEDT